VTGASDAETARLLLENFRCRRLGFEGRTTTKKGELAQILATRNFLFEFDIDLDSGRLTGVSEYNLMDELPPPRSRRRFYQTPTYKGVLTIEIIGVNYEDLLSIWPKGAIMSDAPSAKGAGIGPDTRAVHWQNAIAALTAIIFYYNPSKMHEATELVKYWFSLHHNGSVDERSIQEIVSLHFRAVSEGKKSGIPDDPKAMLRAITPKALRNQPL
jgi:hypothetical protein